jgi:CBS domain-containing protein
LGVTEIIASILKTKGSAVWSVGPDATVYDALALMAERSIGALLVLSEGGMAGIITERDYARKIVLQGKSSKDTPVHEIMTRFPLTVTPEHTVDECMVIMTQSRVRHLPVLDGDRVVGIVSIGDLVNAIISAQAHTINQLHTYISGTYPS